MCVLRPKSQRVECYGVVFVFASLQDLAQYVNEVKRDIETLRDIDQYQKSIENLVSKIMFCIDYYLVFKKQFWGSYCKKLHFKIV